MAPVNSACLACTEFATVGCCLPGGAPAERKREGRRASAAQSFAGADRGIWLPPLDALQAARAAGSEQAGALQARPPHPARCWPQRCSWGNCRPSRWGLPRASPAW